MVSVDGKKYLTNLTTIHDKKKTLSKLGIKGNFLNFIMNIYKNPTADTIHNGENLDFPLRLGKG